MDHIRAAYDGAGKQVQGKFKSRLRMLSQLSYEEWAANGILAKDLRGDGAGLREIRFLADGVQQRPLGFRSGEWEFTLLFWAHEKGGKLIERNACEKALERKKEILEIPEAKDRNNELWLALE